MTQNEYEYYAESQKMTEYEYHSASQKWSNSINKYKFCWASQMEGLQDQFWVSQGDAKFAESPDDWS